MTECVGGREYLYSLLSTVELLAMVEDSTVRDAVCHCLVLLSSRVLVISWAIVWILFLNLDMNFSMFRRWNRRRRLCWACPKSTWSCTLFPLCCSSQTKIGAYPFVSSCIIRDLELLLLVSSLIWPGLACISCLYLWTGSQPEFPPPPCSTLYSDTFLPPRSKISRTAI